MYLRTLSVGVIWGLGKVFIPPERMRSCFCQYLENIAQWTTFRSSFEVAWIWSQTCTRASFSLWILSRDISPLLGKIGQFLCGPFQCCRFVYGSSLYWGYSPLVSQVYKEISYKTVPPKVGPGLYLLLPIPQMVIAMVTSVCYVATGQKLALAFSSLPGYLLFFLLW